MQHSCYAKTNLSFNGKYCDEIVVMVACELSRKDNNEK